jgi:hypothetical protein
MIGPWKQECDVQIRLDTSKNLEQRSPASCYYHTHTASIKKVMRVSHLISARLCIDKRLLTKRTEHLTFVLSSTLLHSDTILSRSVISRLDGKLQSVLIIHFTFSFGFTCLSITILLLYEKNYLIVNLPVFTKPLLEPEQCTLVGFWVLINLSKVCHYLICRNLWTAVVNILLVVSNTS